MYAIPPHVTIPGDSPDSIMAHSLQLRGYSKSRQVWVGGFIPGSLLANAFGVSTSNFHWYLCDTKGKVLATFIGYGIELPKRFKDVLKAELK